MDIENIFGIPEGMEIRRLTPLMYELKTKFPMEFNSEIRGTDLYWNYLVEGNMEDLPIRCYARNYEDACRKSLSIPGNVSIISFHEDILKRMAGAREYFYFYN